MTNYELLDATEIYLVSLLKKEQELKRKGVLGHHVEDCNARLD